MKNNLLLLLIGSFLFSCSNDRSMNNEKLDHIERIVYSYPDSALHLLDSIRLTPDNLLDQNRYFLYRVQAEDNAEKDIRTNKEILEVYAYFDEINNEKLAGLAAYYCGRVLQENKEYDTATTYYNIAESHAIKCNDKNFHAHILYSTAILMIDHLLPDQTKTKLFEANALFHETADYKYEVKTYSLLGIYHTMVGKNDSSLQYFNKGLELAKKYDFKEEQAKIKLCIGIYYHEKEDYTNAINTLKEAMEIDGVDLHTGKLCLNLAYTYMTINMPDSARYYANSCLALLDSGKLEYLYTQIGAYETLSFIEEKAENYHKALEYHKQYSKNLENIFTENKNSAIINANSKYRYDTVKKENTVLSIRQLKTQRLQMLSFLVITIITIVYYRKLLSKNKQLTKAYEEIINLTETVKEFDLTKASYKDNLIHNFNILKRAASLEYFVQDTGNKQGKTLMKSFNTIAYGSESIDWEILYKIINSLNNGLFDKLKEKYQQLDTAEFRICCLIYSKMNRNEIAAITQLSINTVHMKTTSIRKKLGIEKYGNIIEFLDEKLGD